MNSREIFFQKIEQILYVAQLDTDVFGPQRARPIGRSDDRDARAVIGPRNHERDSSVLPDDS